MSEEEIKNLVKDIIKQVADQQGLDIPPVEDTHAVVSDLGFSSLDVATLTALFERQFGVNPFLMGVAAITEVRTINDIAKVYQKAMTLKENPDAVEKSDTVSRSSSRKEARAKRQK